MKILVLGSGAREHAIAWKLSKSNRIAGLYCAPGNAGTAEIGDNLEGVNPENATEVIEACKEYGINYVFVGPEAPLAMGIIDELKAAGIPCFGPHKAAAQLEASKVFSKQFMVRNNIPTAQAHEFDNYKNFKTFIKDNEGMWVIKKSGLAAGKGVFESADTNDLLNFGKDVLKNDKCLVEEFLTGYEISIFTLTDGENYIMLPPCADFKKAEAGDLGLNTGGMGSICPVPIVSKELLATIKNQVIDTTFAGIKKEGLSYKGILYFGLMITDKGPKLLEYNARFGDPETQALLPLIDCDFVNLLNAIEEGTLDQFDIPILDKFSLGVVSAAAGYPGKYKKNCILKNLPKEKDKELAVFHASTVIDKDANVRTTGGRCFTVVGLGDSLINASSVAYEGIKEVDFDGCWSRPDIGNKFMNEDFGGQK